MPLQPVVETPEFLKQPAEPAEKPATETLAEIVNDARVDARRYVAETLVPGGGE